MKTLLVENTSVQLETLKNPTEEMITCIITRRFDARPLQENLKDWIDLSIAIQNHPNPHFDDERFIRGLELIQYFIMAMKHEGDRHKGEMESFQSMHNIEKKMRSEIFNNTSALESIAEFILDEMPNTELNRTLIRELYYMIKYSRKCIAMLFVGHDNDEMGYINQSRTL